MLYRSVHVILCVFFFRKGLTLKPCVKFCCIGCIDPARVKMSQAFALKLFEVLKTVEKPVICIERLPRRMFWVKDSCGFFGGSSSTFFQPC